MTATLVKEDPVTEARGNAHLSTSANEIRAVDLHKSYGKRSVVNGVSVNVRQGEVVGLLGPNGAGKTTTFYMVVGLTRADAGQVFINGTDVTHYPIHQRARMGLGYLAQEASVFRKLTVEQNLQTVLEMTNVRGAEQRATIERLLKDMDIAHVRDQLGYVLSGGERRRTEIARTLATNPAFILLDEPFTGVEPIAVQELQRIISELRDRGMGILITDHNVRETFEITDRSYILGGGKIITQGTPDELMRDPIARKFYLGDKFH